MADTNGKQKFLFLLKIISNTGIFSFQYFCQLFATSLQWFVLPNRQKLVLLAELLANIC